MKIFDKDYDRRSGYFFAVSAGGTMVDGVMYNDDWDDDTWDGVWDGRVTIDDKAWSAELRIPFSQLRFHKSQHYVWGVNLGRIIGRNNEEDYVTYQPRGENGFVSRFADLRGISDISPPAQVELLPYVRTRAEYLQVDADDPFNDGSRYVPAVGGDLKVALGANMTLDATVNPDFGQVEVDPAVVNLSDFETIYPEKRPSPPIKKGQRFETLCPDARRNLPRRYFFILFFPSTWTHFGVHFFDSVSPAMT